MAMFSTGFSLKSKRHPIFSSICRIDPFCNTRLRSICLLGKTRFPLYSSSSPPTSITQQTWAPLSFCRFRQYIISLQTYTCSQSKMINLTASAASNFTFFPPFKSPIPSFSSSHSITAASGAPRLPAPSLSPALRFSSVPTLSFPRNLSLLCSSAKVDNASSSSSSALVKDNSVSVVLLAGGKGKRMGASMPKQYLPLVGQPIALYSFYTLSRMIQVKEVVVVCDPSYKDIFEESAENTDVDLKFALPGKERQDSVFSGLQEIDSNSDLVCIHDSARPLVMSSDIEKVLKDGWMYGAAVLGVPVKATIKEADSESFVARTLDRKTLWEMQTPQVIKPELLRKGFELVNREGLEVTDDVSIVEHLKHPVYITEGSYTNIKVTTPDDLLLAERILSLRSRENES